MTIDIESLISEITESQLSAAKKNLTAVSQEYEAATMVGRGQLRMIAYAPGKR
jgi:hypothetical protein